MIATVKQITEKQGAKGVYSSVTVNSDGNNVSINSFDSVDNQTFKQALTGGRAITLETEKKGNFTNLVKGSVKFLEPKMPIDASTIAPASTGTVVPTAIIDNTNKIIREAVKEAHTPDKPVDTKGNAINKAVALKATVELICADKVPIEQLFTQSDLIMDWLNH